MPLQIGKDYKQLFLEFGTKIETRTKSCEKTFLILSHIYNKSAADDFEDV